MLNRNLLTILVAGVDIWAILFILHFHRPIPWEVSLAVSGPESGPVAPVSSDPVQVRIGPDGVALYPDPDVAPNLTAVRTYLHHKQQQGDYVVVRLLCSQTAKLEDWGPLARSLTEFADEISIAPAPLDTVVSREQ